MDKSLYQRPNKPLRKTVLKYNKGAAQVEIKPIEQPISIDRATECHVTPPHIARKMVSYLGCPGHNFTLEPSAGTGSLVKALLEAEYKAKNICIVERHIKLAEILRRFDDAVINECFIKWSKEVQSLLNFSRILMNPPFSEVKKHMNAAISLLDSNNHNEKPILIALVPITYKNERMEELENLPNTTFASAKVNTKIIRIIGN